MKPLCFCHAYSYILPLSTCMTMTCHMLCDRVSYLSVCRVDTAATRLPLPAWACHSNTHIVTMDGGYHRCFVPFMLLFHAPHFKFYYYYFVMLLIQSADLYRIKLVSYISGFSARHWPLLHFLNFLWEREPVCLATLMLSVVKCNVFFRDEE